MKKNLIAVSLWVALAPALLQAAPKEGSEGVELKINLNNVESLEGLFSGEVSKADMAELSITAVSESSTEVPQFPEVTTVISTPQLTQDPVESQNIEAEVNSVVNEINASAVEVKRNEPIQPIEIIETEAQISVATTAQNDVGATKAKAKDVSEDIIAENFQKFSMPIAAINYRENAEFWGEKAPKEGEAYDYKSRISANTVTQFQKAFADKVAKGALSEDVFVTVAGLTPKGEAIYEALLESEGEGLIPSLYHVGRIHNLLKGDIATNKAEITALLQDATLNYIRDMVMGVPELKRKDPDWLLEGRKVDASNALIDVLMAQDPNALLAGFAPTYPEYQNLKRALLAFKSREAELEPPIVTKGNTIKPGMGGDRVVAMRDRLNYLGYEAGDSAIYDAKMGESVKAFQRTHLLEPDGAAGAKTIAELNRSNAERTQQIQINMERWRWMPESMGDHYVAVDIPGFRYAVVKDGEEVLSARTIVGRDARKTPVFMTPMSYIVFSPYWHVPRSMSVNDFLPRLKQNPNALQRSKIRIFRNGQEVDPTTVDWSQYNRNNFPFQLRQDPGDHNSLGRVKFMFPNEHAIYLHDTPSKYLFDRTSRDFSSGCVRIENPEELAEYFLGEKGWDQNRIKSAFKRTSEAHVSLAKDKKIPVYTLYMTTRVEGDTISFRADIYSKDKTLLETLNNLAK